MNTEETKQEASEDVMITFSFKGAISPPVSLHDFLERMHVYVTGNSLTLSPFPTWCEDSDAACADSGTSDLAWEVESMDVDRRFTEMLESSLEDIEDYPDQCAILRDILIQTATTLAEKLDTEERIERGLNDENK